ncbi:helix-turn-helix domain-containing protein [Salinigranum sp. GCM10025319]|uniref:helix-turn-helix domain-containing protein n=1 Tax=Salinigranum sp. GCM10025319 TaxID=3252687 RepID=UPI00360E2CA3
MVTIAEFELDPDAIPLRKLFERYPEATAELERIVPLQNRAIPYFWVTNTDGLDFEDGYDPGKGIESLRFVDELDNGALVRIEWAREHNGLARALAESQVTLLFAVGTIDGWQMEVRGDSRESISKFYTLCRELDLSLRTTALHELKPGDRVELVELSDPQREALVFAYEQGYYDTPRTTTLSEIAKHFDISRQAVSMRLKRGTRELIERVLIDHE